MIMNRTKVLIVDDYPENITALAELIRYDDIEIFTAQGGDQALDVLSKNEIDIALFDVQMPGMTGFELARLVRGVRKYRHLPIIFVTAQQPDQGVIFEGYDTGAVDLLFKPIDPHVVRSKIRAFVDLSQQRLRLRDHVEQLERLKLQAEAANLAKSQFLANMSHEIRTPLASVMGFAEVLSRPDISVEEKAQSYDAVKRNGHLLMRLIDDILDLSKIEAGKIEFEKTVFDLSEIIADVRDTLSFRAKEKGIDLVIEVGGDHFHGHRSDPIRIKQMLLNVIGNAIKFTARGEVKVDINVRNLRGASEWGSGLDLVTLRVRDQGIGMTDDQADRLFQPFAQADASTRRQFGGSGLGLVISREIARAMGGDLKLVGTELGKGSVFEISLKIERASVDEIAHLDGAEEQVSSAGKALSFAGKDILVVDDAPDNLTLIELFLQGTRANLSFAKNGFEAVEKVMQKKFDMILMDIQMPGKDGHETTEEIRHLGYQNPIIALTAHAIKSEHAKCLRSGCNAVMSKPLDRTKLIELISETF